jgi:hypothetical protein
MQRCDSSTIAAGDALVDALERVLHGATNWRDMRTLADVAITRWWDLTDPDARRDPETGLIVQGSREHA